MTLTDKHFETNKSKNKQAKEKMRQWAALRKTWGQLQELKEDSGTDENRALQKQSIITP